MRKNIFLRYFFLVCFSLLINLFFLPSQVHGILSESGPCGPKDECSGTNCESNGGQCRTVYKPCKDNYDEWITQQSTVCVGGGGGGGGLATCNAAVTNACAAIGKQCVNNVCVTPTPTVRPPTQIPTPTPDTYNCTCSGAYSTPCGPFAGYTNVKHRSCTRISTGTVDCIKVGTGTAATYHQIHFCPTPTGSSTPTPTVRPTATPIPCNAAVTNACATIGKQCVNNICVTPTPTVRPTTHPTGGATPTPTPDTFNCTCSGAYSNPCGPFAGYTNVKYRSCTRTSTGTIDCIKVGTGTAAEYYQIYHCPTPTPTPTGGAACAKKNKGDADCNGAINALDYARWKCEFQGAGTCASANTSVSTNLTSDFNADGRVTIVDFEIFRKNLFE